MLKNLHVHNYFLINNLSLDFSSGFTLITGETGAGKSALVGAIMLLLGGKIDQKTLFDSGKKSIIEGIFDIDSLQLQPFFQEQELDYASETIIRREIMPDAARSRTFINDTPATTAQLKLLGSQLVDIHSQHETLNINNPAVQLQIVDRYGRLNDSVDELRRLFLHIKKLKATLSEDTAALQEALREQEFRQHALQELEEANIKENELNVLEQELQLAGNADALKSWLSKVLYAFKEQDSSIVEIIETITSEGKKITVNNDFLIELLERMRNAALELRDIANDAQIFSETLHSDSQQLQQLEARFDFINRLIFKYHVRDIEQLLALLQRYRQQVDGIHSIEQKIADIQKIISQKELEWNKLALEVSAQRMALIPQIEQQMNVLLHTLGMPDASFIIKKEVSDEPMETGLDKIHFLFTANKGHQPDEIKKVASGGELSRIMLSIKNLMGKTKLFPTMIFDEIDAGISGAVAAKAGKLLKKMSEEKQIIAITHLPTIAAFADHHLYVKKKSGATTPQITVQYLSKEERIQELAQMLSGDQTMHEALETAEKLLHASTQ